MDVWIEAIVREKDLEIQRLKQELGELKHSAWSNEVLKSAINQLPLAFEVVDGLGETVFSNFGSATRSQNVKPVEFFSDGIQYELFTTALIDTAFQDYHFIFNQIRDGILVFTEEGEIIEANAVFCDLLGYSMKNLMYENVYNLTARAWADFERVNIIDPQVKQFGFTQPYRKDFRHLQGFPVPVIQQVYRLNASAEGNRLFWLIARDQSDIIRSEKLLTEKDSMFRQIVANMLESVLVCDAVYDNEYRLIDFLIKDANFAFENLSGMDKKTFIGKQGLDFWPKMDSVWFEKAAIVLRTGKPQLFDQFSPSWNKYLRVTLYSPGPDKIVLVISDVSDSVRAEIELRDRERELNAIFENSPLLMILLDENRNVLKINKPRSSLGRFQKGMVVERLLGNALNCLNIHKYKNVCAQGDACKDCKIADIYGNVLESKSSFEYHETDFWMITDYGPLKISIQLNASFFLQGGLNRVLLVINDVTDLKKIGSALQESEKRYKLLSNLTREGVVVAFQQVVVDVNRAFEQMTGIPKTQLIGKNTSDLFDGLPEKSYSLSDPDRDLGVIEVEVFRHDATTFPAEIGMFAYKYNGEDLRVTTVYDLTHKKEAVLNITKAAVEAEEHERMRLARELHDGIGPLLSTAKIYIDALRGATTEVRRVDAIARLKDTIEESLVGIREVSNRISPHVLKNFGLEVAIETFISKLNVMPNLQIGFRSTLYLRSQMYIETTIFRIVTELLVNSLKHAQATEIQVVLGVEASDIILAYTDNGVGFDLNAHTHGMGLFNIRARVQNFNGRIFFETSKGTGLKVRLAIKYEAATKDTIL